MSEKRTRLGNGDKMAILEAIRIPAVSFWPQEKGKDCDTSYFCENERGLFIMEKSKIFEIFVPL